MSDKIERKVPWAVVVPLAFAVGMTACGGGGGGAATSSASTNSDGEVISSIATGYDVPSDISAVPSSDASSNSGSNPRGFRASLRALARDVGHEGQSDYESAVSNTYVEENSLEQFDIIETILKTLAQTKYAEAGNVNDGPYQAVVAWEEDSNGRSQKQLETWTVDSRMIVGDIPSDVTQNTTGDINRVLVWIPEADESTGEARMLKAEFRIYSAANITSDGSVLDFGEWDFNVYFDANPDGADVDTSGGFFAASARLTADGTQSTLKVHQLENSGMSGALAELKGILVRNASSGTGYGKVAYPDYQACWNDPSECTTEVPEIAAEYSYNEAHLAVRDVDADGTPEATVYKDRDLDGAIRVVHRYGLFYRDANADAGIEAGQNLEEVRSFGFPVRFEAQAQDTDATFGAWGYYGAWQGRHQLWGQNDFVTESEATGLDPATVFTKADVAPGETAETYTLVEFNGTMTSRTLAVASLENIENVPVQTWLNKHYDLVYDGGVWKYCDGFIAWMDHDANPGTPNAPQCVERSDGTTPKVMSVFSDFTQLLQDETGRKHVNIGTMVASTWTQFGYLTSAGSSGVDFTDGVGFYPMTMGDNGPEFQAGGTKLAPNNGDRLSVDISGSIYIAYTGEFAGPDTTTGWVQKTMTEFDEQNWKPVFDNTEDQPFVPERGFEYYLNAAGQNFVVVRTDEGGTGGFEAGDFEVSKELQSAANPANTGDLFPAGTDYLGTPWRPEVQYEFVADDSNPDFLMLVYKTDDPAEDGDQIGDVVESDLWGLQAFNATGDPLGADGSVVAVDEYGMPMTATRPVQFNWEYSGETEQWGKQQFLKKASDAQYALLSDPVFLNNVPVHDSAHIDRGTLDLQFDGWMHGFPNIYEDLRENDFVMTPDIGGKARHIGSASAETLAGDNDVVVTDEDGVSYYVKALQTSLFLGVVSTPSPAPDIDLAGAVDLDSVPDYTAHGMGAMPDAELRYSEGELLE